METPEVRRYVWYTTKISVCLHTFKVEENGEGVKQKYEEKNY